MPLHIENYLTEINIWPMIVKYMKDSSDTYGLMSPSAPCSVKEEQILKTLRKCARKNLLPASEYDSFRHAVTHLYNGRGSTLSRENVYRLCFSLELPDDKAANKLCTEYLNQAELSPRSLDEFIIICALRIHLDWNDTCRLRRQCKERLQKYPIAPLQLVENQTVSFYQTVVTAQIDTKAALEAWLSEDSNLAFFSRTRNRQYFALFSDMDWESFNTYRMTGDPLDVNRTIRLYQMAELLASQTAEKATITMKEYFDILFGLHSVDDSDDMDPESFLNEREIAALSKRYPSVFLTYETFCDLVQRRRPVDISAGTYTIRMLEEMNPDAEIDAEYVDFTDRNTFLKACDSYLMNAGYPRLVANNIFNKLLLDIYDETLEENPDSASIEIKAIFFEKLRWYLKQIAGIA